MSAIQHTDLARSALTNEGISAYFGPDEALDASADLFVTALAQAMAALDVDTPVGEAWTAPDGLAAEARRRLADLLEVHGVGDEDEAEMIERLRAVR